MAFAQTIPGFDVLTSIAFIAEVGDISRFRKPIKLPPFRASSQGLLQWRHHAQRRITKCGPN
ncbi:MAG: transposase [Candidatus Obscuribacter sp.]|nr:transposase [Candidatus Obscuribacter sp.]